MRYNKFDTVRFKAYDGKEKTGKIISVVYSSDAYWVKVAEKFSYQDPVVDKGRIIRYTQNSTEYIEYFVKRVDVIRKEEVEDARERKHENA